LVRGLNTAAAAAAAAAALQQALGGLSHMALWLQLPMTEPAAAQQQQQQDASAASGNSNSSSSCCSPDWFEYWCTLFTLCEQSSLLGVALVVPPDLPSKPAVQRWLAQPLKALLLPTSERTDRSMVRCFCCYCALLAGSARQACSAALAGVGATSWGAAVASRWVASVPVEPVRVCESQEWVPALVSKPAVQRWLAQPLKALLLPTSE
jgi:hypothetical protein